MESLDPLCRPGASCPPKTCALLLPTSRACMFRVLRRQHKMWRLWTRANRSLRRIAPAVMATQERAVDPQPVLLPLPQQISTSRSLPKNGRGMFWKMACRVRRCPRGGTNSARIKDVPWSNSCVLFTTNPRRPTDNDQTNCDRNLSHYVRPASGMVAMAGVPRLDRGTEIFHAPAGTPL